MKPGFSDYVRAAFSARPIGMFVPPNWIGLAAFGMLGALNPGFWAIGAGLELGYLLFLSTNSRFQRTVAASRLTDSQQQSQAKLIAFINRLDARDRQRYQTLTDRCHSILDLQLHGDVSAGLQAQSESLARLSWTYLRLLLTRRAIQTVLGDSGGSRDTETVPEQIRKLEARLKEEGLTDELRRSLSSQLEILRQRSDSRGEARDKLAFIDAELTRIEQQIELIREQAALSNDPEVLSSRIDEITATLGGTSQWIREQQRLYGATQDLLEEPPPLPMQTAAREHQ